MNKEDPLAGVSAIELRPVGMYDTGLQVLKPDVDSAVESMIATGCMVILYEKRTLMSLYKNVSRRNSRLSGGAKPGEEGYTEHHRLWTHRTIAEETGEIRWMVRLRTPGELFNPFYTAGQENQYGRWLPAAEQLIQGNEVTVDSIREATRVGQSFRYACDHRGFIRSGRMLRRRKEGRKWIISLAKPVERAEPKARKPKAKAGTAKPKKSGRKPGRPRKIR